jgi:hypothetical protein
MHLRTLARLSARCFIFDLSRRRFDSANCGADIRPAQGVMHGQTVAALQCGHLWSSGSRVGDYLQRKLR